VSALTLSAALSMGLGIGVVLGMLGGGGAVLAVPVLVSVLGQDVHAATTISLVVVGSASLLGGVRQAGEHQVCWRAAVLLAVAAIPGAAAGAVANAAADGRLILGLLGVLILAVAGLTWRRAGGRFVEGATASSGCPQIPVPRMIVAGLVLGALTGFFGVGGGFVLVPALALALHFPFRRAIGTSLVIIFLVSLTGFVSHMATGADIDWRVAAPFAAATMAGSLIGASFSSRVPQVALARMFALLLTGVGVATLLGA
jgi:uncharacterized membrane protein YfcA